MTNRNQTPARFALTLSKFILAWAITVPAMAQNMIVYSNSLVNGWQNWGYATLNYANTSPVYTGCQYSVSVTIGSAYAGIQIYHSDLNSAPYASISFWLNGGASGGQNLQVYGLLDQDGSANQAQSGRYYLTPPTANTWQQYTVPLSTLSVANMTNFTGFVIQDSAGTTEPTFYLDNIQLNATQPPPSQIPVTVNAKEPIRTADTRWFGLNGTIWDGNFDTPQTIALLTNMGIQAVRFPGGSDSDDYHWLYNRQDNNDWSWSTSLASYIQVMTNIGGQSMITLNYGTGTSNEAAAWVAYCNASVTSTVALGTDTNGFNWRTAGYRASLRAATPLAQDDGKNFLRLKRTAPLGFKYWEIGNEVYGAPGKPTATRSPTTLTPTPCDPAGI